MSNLFKNCNLCLIATLDEILHSLYSRPLLCDFLCPLTKVFACDTLFLEFEFGHMIRFCQQTKTKMMAYKF